MNANLSVAGTSTTSKKGMPTASAAEYGSDGRGRTRRADLTYEQVAEVCDALADDGEKVSLRRLREELGGGSFGTIGGFLRRWQDVRTAQDAASGGDMVTPALREALAAAVRAYGQEAQEQAQERITKLENLCDAMQRALVEVEARNIELEAEVVAQRSDAARTAQAHSAKLAEARAHTEAAESRVGELTSQLKGAERAAEDARHSAAASHSRAEALDAQVRVLQASEENLRSELRAPREGATSLERQVAQAEQRAAVAEARSEDRGVQLVELKGTVEALQKAAADRDAQLTEASRARAVAEERVRTLDEARQESDARVLELQRQVERFAEQMRALQRDREGVEGKGRASSPGDGDAGGEKGGERNKKSHRKGVGR